MLYTNCLITDLFYTAEVTLVAHDSLMNLKHLVDFIFTNGAGYR